MALPSGSAGPAAAPAGPPSGSASGGTAPLGPGSGARFCSPASDELSEEEPLRRCERLRRLRPAPPAKLPALWLAPPQLTGEDGGGSCACADGLSPARGSLSRAPGSRGAGGEPRPPPRSRRRAAATRRPPLHAQRSGAASRSASVAGATGHDDLGGEVRPQIGRLHSPIDHTHAKTMARVTLQRIRDQNISRAMAARLCNVRVARSPSPPDRERRRSQRLASGWASAARACARVSRGEEPARARLAAR